MVPHSLLLSGSSLLHVSKFSFEWTFYYSSKFSFCCCSVSTQYRPAEVKSINQGVKLVPDFSWVLFQIPLLVQQ